MIDHGNALLWWQLDGYKMARPSSFYKECGSWD